MALSLSASALNSNPYPKEYNFHHDQLVKPLNSRRKGGHTGEETDAKFNGGLTELSGPTYVRGPVDGSLYAQVDKNLKKQIRSYSLDSGIHSRGADARFGPYEHEARTLGYKSRYVPKTSQPPQTATLNRLQFQHSAKVHSDSDLAMEPDFGGKIQSIDKLLKELGECSELLDNTIQHGKKPSERSVQPASALQELSSAPMGDRQETNPDQPHMKDRIQFYNNKVYPPTPLRRAASYDAAERYQDRHAVPNKLARTMSSGNSTPNGIGSYRRSPENGGTIMNPRNTSTPKKEGLQQAPKTKVTPPGGPLSPKYYATQFVMPYKTTVSQSCGPSGVVEGAPTSSPKSKGFLIGDTVEVNFDMNGYNNSVSPLEALNGKGGVGRSPSDINNNAGDLRMAQIDTLEFEPEREEERLPEKGNVASKVAYLTEIVFPAQPHSFHTPLKGTVPMPGLVSKSPSEVSNEISKYNATSLAPGEVSRGSSTLYRGGVPRTITEHHPGQSEDVDGHVDPELAQKLLAAREKTAAAESAGLADEPAKITDSGSMELVSIDDGIGSKADTDEGTTPGSAPSISSDGPTDSAFGDYVSSTPATSQSSNVHAVIVPVQENEIEAELMSRDSSISSLLDHMERQKDDDEVGYARLEEIQMVEHAAKKTDTRPSPIMISDDIHTQLSLANEVSSHPEFERSTTPAEAEAIDGILSEMADISLQLTPASSETPVSTGTQNSSEIPVSIDTPGTPRTPTTPTSSSSGPFDNSPNRKRSPYHSDKGYSSNTSLSSDSSGDVFLDITAVPGLKFDKDNSQFWYKPNISRFQAINILKDKAPGIFVVRDSQSFPGAYGLAVKVAIPPAHVLQGDLTKVDLTTELIRHFLIESTKKGVKLKGCSNEPVFGSLSAFVFQHTITPLSLPLRLVIPSEDLMPEQSLDRPDAGVSPTSPTNETIKVMFIGESGVEMLSGATAVQRTVEELLKYQSAPKFTTTSFKVSKQGITVTDNERKVFFRRHFPISSVLYCGIDPLDKRWDLNSTSFSGKSRTFGVVVRKMGEVGNECHIFAEIDQNFPVNTVINLVNRFMASPS